ncbi:hypothetical protein [Methylobacterium indicum]|uniref:Uncharacterized protein n=1 Tax=Methylobacterium indicum TaxID=1775910 RepID=A0A0J6UAD6_9HYPH|nr:hypothetical protein [Methylobacterium indicum]KMO22611.1 hypothetical protein QR78_06585 [Methylobacterium indicum]KMO25596.1 hypothetical protein QR79_06995 [Methylobacterium indicum]BCM85977.1 hypothetical protein mvi_44380 [Methylobacterium indicum]
MAARSRLQDGTGLLLLTLAPFLVVALPRSDAVAVLGRPGAGIGEAAAIVAAAGGRLVRAGPAGLVVARSEAPGFVRRLYGAGAWLVLDPLVAGGCGPSPPATSRHSPPSPSTAR